MKHSGTEEARKNPGHNCLFVVPLSTLPELRASVCRGLASAQAEGAITKFRAAPTGEEACVYVGHPSAPFGFATFYDAGLDRVWLDILYVEPLVRRGGIAGELIDMVEWFSAGWGRKQLLFGTDAGNTAMRALIEKKRGVPVDAVEYRIDLSPAKAEGGLR